MQLIATKFFVSPAPGDYVLRPRLMAKLGQCLQYGLTVLAAPAGFGKTTLVSAWIREITAVPLMQDGHEPANRVQACWLSLNLEDNQAARFLEDLITSIEDAGVLLKGATAFLPIQEEGHSRPVLNAFLEDLSSQQNEIVLIFDDYHVIENKEIHGFIAYLVAHAPRRFHILISTRCEPPFETGKLRVSGQLLELGPEELRFSFEEIKEYLQGAPGLALTDREVAIIARKTEGWIAGLKMAALSMQKSEDPAAFVNALNGSHRYIFDYLMEQVLARQTPEVRDFLIRTSIVEGFTPSLCEALLQDGSQPPGRAQKTLAYLERANLFLVPLDDERQWYRYHHLFAELLRTILRQSQPELAAGLHRSASDWYERNQMIPEAVTHAIAAGDTERAAHMISANVLLLVEQTELRSMFLRLEALFGGEKPVENPWLNVAYAWVLAFTGEVKRAAHSLKKIEGSLARMEGAGDRQELAGNLRAIQAYLEYVGGQHRKAAELARQAAGDLAEAEAAVQALNLTTLANALSELRDYQKALQAGQQAVDLGNAAGQANIVMLASSGLAYTYRNLGSIQKSSEICEQALELAEAYRRKHGHVLPAVASVYAIQATNFYKKYELERAFQYAKRGLAISETWGQTDTKMVASWVMFRILKLKNEPEAARRVLEAARQTARRTSEWFTKLARLEEGFDCLENGDLESAREIARELVNFEAAVDPELSIFYPLCVEVLVTDGEYGKALRIIDQTLELLKGFPGGYKTQMLVLRARACHEQGDDRGAGAALESALRLAEPEAHVENFIDAFEHIEGLLRNIAARGKFKALLERIFAIHESLVEPAGAASQRAGTFSLEAGTLIEPLTEREIDVLRFLNSHLPTPEIADTLDISVNTVRTHIKSIYAKLDVHSRSEAIGLAKRLKILA